MRRVVVTGLGITSSIGNNAEEVADSLKAGRSGIVFAEEYARLGFRSQVHGTVKIDLDAAIDRRQRRFMGDGAAYAYLAMEQAIADSGLEEREVVNERTGLIVGSGGPSTRNLIQAADITREKGPKKIGPFMVPRCMSSTCSAVLSTAFRIKGVNYSISSACSTSAHCIGNAAELIQLGKQDIVFAGGGEELDWTLSVLFDAMPAMSSAYNDTPEKASRAYDKNRDGFVIAGGGGILVMEELEHAKARGARIYAELVGYGATSDGADMVAPSGEGAVRCMKQALNEAARNGHMGHNAPVDYINTHGTSTPAGDITELNAIREVFGEAVPAISSTKSLTGHSLGAAGVHEAIYSLLMMRDNFLAASANIETLDPGAEGFPILRERKDNVTLNRVMSNSFGFGGTNATLLFQRYDA
ncbi:MAG TPA: beta-ketoacyl-ACP synthase I [Ferrovibrio sp.]|uniref:beta-ketoacyl-ACP synthase I n=1 Tax=Ferrovibrio sp. TaxID=1917215 RepID=UPI002B4AC075|nr:beta-ketoacyl-ACP synthase I [Ferrovibrio sp.]HLT77990.1 beta-ketoacyl-ACP synthase I [Ferrovibrio sp.]